MPIISQNDNNHIVIQPPTGKALIIGGQQGLMGPQGLQGAQGIQGNQGPSLVLDIAFSWSDISPLPLTTIPAGKMVFKVEIIFKTPFDISSIISVGDSGNHEALIPEIGFDSSLSGTYQFNPDYTYLTETTVNLYKTLGGGVSAGNGLILLYIQD